MQFEVAPRRRLSLGFWLVVSSCVVLPGLGFLVAVGACIRAAIDRDGRRVRVYALIIVLTFAWSYLWAKLLIDPQFAPEG